MYVVQENERVLQAAAQLPTNDFPGFGKNMFATHTGLSTLYEVSCEEADFLVDLAQESGYVLGARMMGGGFGGCVLVLVPKANKISWITLAKERYHLEYARTLVDYSVAIGNGTSCLHI
jgi:galactokinase